MSSPAQQVIVIGMDGASMELTLNMIEWGNAPNLKRLLQHGVHRPMVGVFPTLTPPGWTTLSTGTWPGTHGVMDFNIRATGKPLTETVWGINTELCQTEYIWNTVERAGKRPILVKWEMSWPPTVRTGIQVEGTGPGVSNHHQIAGYHLFVAGRWAPRPIGGDRDPETLDPSALQEDAPYDLVRLRPATSWTNLPFTHREPLEVDLTVQPLTRGRPDMLRGTHGEPKPYHGVIYARDGARYDRVRITRTRDGDDVIADLGVADWSDWHLDDFVIDGSSISGHIRFKLITLTPDADSFELFVPQIWPASDDYTFPPTVGDDIVRNVGPFLQNPARDALGVFDDDTYFELLEYHHQGLASVARFLTEEHPWDLLMVESHATDYASHFFLGQADAISGADAKTIERCLRGLQRTYESVDRMIGRVADLADDTTAVLIVSDHGGTPSQHRPVVVNDVLEQAGLLAYEESPVGGEREIDLARSTAVGVGLVHIFINLAGREPAGIVDPKDYERTQRRIIDALHAYVDPETEERPFTFAVTREDAEMLNLWGDRVGDVVYGLRPGWDGAHGKHLPSTRFGIGGQHSTLIMSGAGVRSTGAALARQVRSVDVAPTIAYLLGVPVSERVEGGVIYEALEAPNSPLSEPERRGEAELTASATATRTAQREVS